MRRQASSRQSPLKLQSELESRKKSFDGGSPDLVFSAGATPCLEGRVGRCAHEGHATRGGLRTSRLVRRPQERRPQDRPPQHRPPQEQPEKTQLTHSPWPSVALRGEPLRSLRLCGETWLWWEPKTPPPSVQTPTPPPEARRGIEEDPSPRQPFTALACTCPSTLR
jgi:hypothetical protein